MGILHQGTFPQLVPNEGARPFRMTDLEGNMVSLDSYRGSYLFLSFQRYAGCPLCNLRLHELAESTPKLKASGFPTQSFPTQSSRSTVFMASVALGRATWQERCGLTKCTRL